MVSKPFWNIKSLFFIHPSQSLSLFPSLAASDNISILYRLCACACMVMEFSCKLLWFVLCRFACLCKISYRTCRNFEFYENYCIESSSINCCCALQSVWWIPNMPSDARVYVREREDILSIKLKRNLFIKMEFSSQCAFIVYGPFDTRLECISKINFHTKFYEWFILSWPCKHSSAAEAAASIYCYSIEKAR